MKDGRTVANNVFMLYIMNITQLVLPLITLPYLTRILSVDGYGVVSYVKSITAYITLVIEFGFLLSGTREVVKVKNDREKLNKVVSRVIQGKLLLSLIAFLILIIMIMTIPILKRHIIFALLSFGSPFLSIFLFDFLFRGLEKMHIVTIRYLIMKGISTILTFVFIKGESQLNLIPILDIIGSIVAVFWIHKELQNMGIKIYFVKFREVLTTLKTSFVYFISEISTTAFGALNTFLVGIYLSPSDVAFWGIVMTLVTAVQSMYSPISNGIYPHMVEKKSIRLFSKIILFFLPILFIGGIITFFGAKVIILIIAGDKYIPAIPYLRESVPLLIISFFSILFGWPLLGAIDKVKETTITTVSTAILQVLGLVILITTQNFTIPSLIFVRTITELFMATFRILYVYKFRNLFSR